MRAKLFSQNIADQTGFEQRFIFAKMQPRVFASANDCAPTYGHIWDALVFQAPLLNEEIEIRIALCIRKQA